MRQMSKTRRRLAAGAFLVVAGPVALGSVAYACQSLATLHANPNAALPGDTISLFGKNYSSSATSSAIVIHLDARDGAVIASFPPASVLSGPATIPPGTAAGTHTLVATQYTAAGNAVSGTPGRAALTINVSARTSADGVAAGPAATASSGTVTATPAAVTPASPAAPAAPAAVSSAPAQSVAASATSTGSAAPAANVANVASTPSASGAATSAAPVVSAPDAASAAVAAPAAPVAGPASVHVGLLPASAQSTSILPGLTLVAGLALVLLGLVAFLKSGRSILGRTFGPLAG